MSQRKTKKTKIGEREESEEREERGPRLEPCSILDHLFYRIYFTQGRYVHRNTVSSLYTLFASPTITTKFIQQNNIQLHTSLKGKNTYQQKGKY